jgi:hypothetical protein
LSGISWKRTVLALLLFGTAFGYLEAAVVTYLRALHEPARQRFYPGRPAAELFPLLTLEQLRAAGPEQQRTLAAELGREAATILMLAAVAMTVARNAGEWGAAFVIAFGVWDLTFYIFLKVLLDWPASVFTWDILFLIPVPWAGPVLAPVLVSIAMIAAGVWHLRTPVRIGPAHWFAILLGAGVIVVSFAMDYRNLMAGGMPQRFNWWVYAAGLGIGLGSYATAARGRLRRAAAVAVTVLVLSGVRAVAADERSKVPSDRSADTYAVYSAVLAHPSLSHPDGNEKYLVQEVSGEVRENEPQSCISVPEPYRTSLAEVLADRMQVYEKRFLLERAFKIPKQYELITAEQAKQFGSLRFSPGHSTDEVELFRGATDVISLGHVYFDKRRILSAVYTWAFCGSLCGYGTWRLFPAMTKASGRNNTGSPA